jgi:hypothetical protein
MARRATVKAKSTARLVRTCDGTGELENGDDNDEPDVASDRRPSSQDRGLTVDALQQRREQLVNPIYDSWVAEIANAWRTGK